MRDFFFLLCLFQTVIIAITHFSLSASSRRRRRSLGEFHDIEFRNARMKCFVSAVSRARARESEIEIEKRKKRKKRFRIHFYLFATRDLKLMPNSALSRARDRDGEQKEKQRFRSIKIYSNFECPELRQRRMKLLSPLREPQKRDKKRKAKRSPRTLLPTPFFFFLSSLLFSTSE